LSGVGVSDGPVDAMELGLETCGCVLEVCGYPLSGRAVSSCVAVVVRVGAVVIAG
jgi:hypothetical protein